MKELFTLGNLYVSDFLKDGESPRGGSVEMKMMLEPKTGSVRLENIAPLDTMYGKYWYRSGINHTMKKELKSIVNSITDVVSLKENDLWIDIACNDGTLLSYVPDNLIKVGIDPVDDSFKKESEKHANLIIQDYFSSKLFKDSKFGNLKAKVITTIAMFYDLEEPKKFVNDIVEVLDDNGVWVLQLSYTPLMIEQLAFDNICHEHVYYWSLISLQKLMTEAGLTIVDCQLNDVNGGSFRVYIKKQDSDMTKFATRPYRDVCEVRMESILKWEDTQYLDSNKTWVDFYDGIENLKKQTVDFIKEEKSKGKKICGYGASTKGNTLLQYFGLNHTLIDAIAERSPYKYGHKTIGTNIPVMSEDDVRKMNPDYMLVLPWHFISEFTEREKEYLTKGGKFIVPCPKFEIICK